MPSENKDFWVEGTITIKVSLEVKAKTEKEALKKAEEGLRDDYNLDVFGYNHDPRTDIKLDLEAGEYDDE
jgi:hypothetical protein